jgi:hypothetical protein
MNECDQQLNLKMMRLENKKEHKDVMEEEG